MYQHVRCGGRRRGQSVLDVGWGAEPTFEGSLKGLSSDRGEEKHCHNRCSAHWSCIACIISAKLARKMAETGMRVGLLAVEAAAGYILICGDNDLAKYCMAAPRHFRCTREGILQYDLPEPRCRDSTRCSCEAQATGSNARSPACQNSKCIDWDINSIFTSIGSSIINHRYCTQGPVV